MDNYVAVEENRENRENRANHTNQVDYVTITKSTVEGNLPHIIIYGVWSGYYLRDVINLNKNMINTGTTQLLIGFMLFVFWKFFDSLKKYYVDSTLIGQVMTIHVYNSRLYFDNSTLIYVSNFVSIYFQLVMMSMTFKFTPFTNHNCYGYTTSMCTNGRVGAFFGIVLIITYSIIILLIIFIMIFAWYNPMYFEQINFNFRNHVSTAQRIPILNQLPVLQHLTIHNEECAICIQNGTESEDSNFVTLPCNHKFHDACIRQWLTIGNALNCPICRAPMRLQENNLNNLNNPIISTVITLPQNINSTNV